MKFFIKIKYAGCGNDFAVLGINMILLDDHQYDPIFSAFEIFFFPVIPLLSFKDCLDIYCCLAMSTVFSAECLFSMNI